MPVKLEIKKGDRYGLFTIIKEVKPVQSGKISLRRFKCKCDCGNTCVKKLQSLRIGDAKSCGCLKRSGLGNVTHNLSYHPLYHVWTNMLDRCVNLDHPAYLDYGARGIKVCKSWSKDVANFIGWAELNGYKKGLELDRRDNDKGYSPSNCRFVTARANNRNKRNNVRISFKGKEMLLIVAVEKHAIEGLSYKTVWDRVNRGWPAKKALTTPLKIGGSNGHI